MDNIVKVLVVTGCARDAKIFEILLSEIFDVVDTSTSVSQAVRLARAAASDLVILDLDSFSEKREHVFTVFNEQFSNRIVVLSDRYDHGEVEGYIGRGVLSYIDKRQVNYQATCQQCYTAYLRQVFIMHTGQHDRAEDADDYERVMRI